MKIVALDYDGVLVYSRKETFVVAYNTYVRLFGFKNLPNISFNAGNFAEIERRLKDAEADFSKMRPYCSLSCMFSSVLNAIDSGINFENEKTFLEFRKNLKEKPEFRKEFHNERERLQKEDFNAFLKLTPVFGKVIESVKILKQQTRVVIITANRKDLVHKTLKANGLDIKLSDIYDLYGDKRNKREIIKHLMEENEIIFVDDLYEQLTKVRDLKIKVFLADWGFERGENKRKARKEGIEVIGEEEFYSKIHNFLNK
jgi:phosphoglycolate phosphatase-like HAD superfamily hydrolase